MNAPTITAKKPDLATLEPNAHFAVVVMGFPDDFTDLAHTMLQHALVDALSRSEIKEQACVSYFRRLYSARMFEVAPAEKLRAIEAVRSALDTLGILFRAGIAIKTADGVWQGLPRAAIQCIKFERHFLSEEQWSLSWKEREARLREWNVTMAALKMLMEKLDDPDFKL